MDEARFGTHSKIGYGWFPKGQRPRLDIKLGFKNFYAYSAINPLTGKSFNLLLPKVNAEIMSIFLEEFSQAYPNNRITLVVDGAGWHRAKNLRVPENIKLVFLPPYSPELNPVERFWLYMKKKILTNRLYDSVEDLQNAACLFLRSTPPATIAQICAINWFN